MKTEHDFSIEYKQHKHMVLEAIDRVLVSGRYILGKEVEKFEKLFAEFTKHKYCIAVGNGYDALYLSYVILRLDNKKVCIVNQLHISTTNAALAIKARILCERSPCIIRENMKVDVIVSVFNPVNGFGVVVANGNIPVIEDACQAIGARAKYKPFGILSCFSFHPLKVLHCYGDGGAICTDDKALADNLRILRNHGRIGRTNKYLWGVNSRLDEIQAAILNVWLRHLMVK